MPELCIRLLGPPEVEHRGQPVAVERHKTMALLAFVALAGKPCDRDALGRLLWPEVRPGGASAYLRHALWLIKQTPISPWLETPGSQVVLRRDPECWIDVTAFREHVRAGRSAPPERSAREWPGAARLAQAARLYRGDFMAGFSLRGSVDFEDWHLRQEEALRRDLAESLARLVSWHEARREMGPAMRYARRWLDLDPLDEQAQARLILLQARAGHRAAALRLFERCERLLREELGVAPGPRMLRLRQRIVSGDLDEAPRPAAGPQPHPALPQSLTPFVGREGEIAEIGRILSDEGCRLLALIGSGGSGKTRLALQAAHVHGGAFAGGAAFVPLANVISAEQVLPAVLAALRISAQVGAALPHAMQTDRAARERLFDFLREKQMLLILDNVEHVLDGLEWVEGLGVAAPRVRILLTSRVRPGISGAWVLEVGGLPCPDAAATTAAGRTFAAVQLFLEYARRARVGFEPDAAELAAVSEICRALDGLPLGIELAAAWARTLPCRELAAEIRRSVDFLKDSPAAVAERHRGLRAVFTQSWAHLSPHEQRDFRRLALFRGGFTRRAAEEIAGATPQVLTTLLDKSLLRRMPSGRYELLEVVRQFAEEHLREVPQEWADVRQRHARFFLSDLASRRADLQGERVAEALNAAMDDADNLRQAWTAALDPPQLDLLVPALIPYFLLHDVSSRWAEGEQRFHEAGAALVQAADPQGRLVHGFSLVAEGWFLRESDWQRAIGLIHAGEEILGSLTLSLESTYGRTLAAVETLVVDRAETERRLQRVAAEQEGLGDRWGLALTLEIFSLAAADAAERERYALRSLALREEIGDRWGTSLANYIAGLAARARGEYGLTRERLTRSIALRRELDIDPLGVASCLLQLGWTALEEGEGREAERWFTECLDLSREHGCRLMIVLSERGLGATALQAEQLGDAREHFEKALALMGPFAGKCSPAEVHGILANIDLAAARPGDARERLAAARAIDPDDTWVMLAAARLALADGNRPEAFGLLREALAQIARRSADAPRGPAEAHAVIECLLETAERLSGSDDPAEAFVVCGVLLRHPALRPAKRTRISRMLRRAARRVPRAQRAAALAAGRELTLERLVDRILAAAPFADSRTRRSAEGS